MPDRPQPDEHIGFAAREAELISREAAIARREEATRRTEQARAEAVGGTDRPAPAVDPVPLHEAGWWEKQLGVPLDAA